MGAIFRLAMAAALVMVPVDLVRGGGLFTHRKLCGGHPRRACCRAPMWNGQESIPRVSWKTGQIFRGAVGAVTLAVGLVETIESEPVQIEEERRAAGAGA